ncbi:MAG: type II toxin-antitoxin system RelE/ParE family toxin [Ignavibacteriae bacterium]|nr:MAG: type II toxin-antitoxin system RelE/ParE family toxin [Ignavibacteriota bacterium]
MSEYKILFDKSAGKEVDSLNINLAIRILDKIEMLSNNPRPMGCEKLKGEENLWRIRVGSYRVIYSINDKNKVVNITIVRHRKDAYK